MRDLLNSKKAKFIQMRSDIINEDFSEGIEKEVNAYRQSLIDQVEKEKAKRISKVDSYLEIIEELLNSDEVKNEDTAEETENQLEENDEIVEEE